MGCACMVERGEIEHRERARQLRDFRGLVWGTITPTDLDGFLDFGNKVFIFIEYKYKDKKMDRGQELALERLVDIVPKPCIAIHATHNQDDPRKDIDSANAKVVRYYCKENKGVWSSETAGTVKEIIDLFLKKHKVL